MNKEKIILKKIRVHNLKSIDLTLNKNQLIIFTGVSGSGKSSAAFDTIFVEGQRSYVESLSIFVRRQLGELKKPDLEHCSGISPTISIEQKTAGKNPRSTVGTMTEIYDYLRVLYARIGTAYCPISGEKVTSQSKEKIIQSIQDFPTNHKIILLAPIARSKKGEFKEEFIHLLQKGYTKARVDGEIINLDEGISLDGELSHDVDIVIDRIVTDPANYSRIAESVTHALQLGEGLLRIIDQTENKELLFSIHAFSPKSGIYYPELQPQDFSFNSPSGMCTRCQGMGTIYEFNLDLIINPDLSIAEDCCSIASSYTTVRYGNIYRHLAKLYRFDVNTPWKKLSKQAQKVFLYGIDEKWIKMTFTHPVTGIEWVDHVQWKGVLFEAHRRYTEAKSESYKKKAEKLMHLEPCPECKGSRIKPYPSAALLGDKNIAEVTQMTISDAYDFFAHLQLSEMQTLIGKELLKEITQRLEFLLQVGLHYLTLDRTSPTLSGGESQRVRLASQIGCGLVGIIYVLDEPSIGLHPRDNKRLIATLKHLRDLGNTVIVVEHDEETILAADQIVDFGPKAGIHGGEIVVNGTLKNLLDSENSLTGQYLSGKKSIEIPKKRRKQKKDFCLEIIAANHHNLKNINVKIPLGLFVAVTGVSGSGKSSLISDILAPALSNLLHKGEHTVGAHKEIKGVDLIDKVIVIDQSPIGRNPRSNAATYIKVFDEIRDLFTMLPESQAKGYKAGRFSFNVKEGSCTQCEGMGLIKVEMDFLDDEWVDCPLCQTKRFDPETLSILYKEKNINDILEMDVAEAAEFFINIPSIHHKLEQLKLVGLDYLKLGQSSTTLSGGEAQRIKLAKELSRPSTGKTLYILDEPTTGLHFYDIHHLLNVLQTLVDKGNTVLVIEHNMDVVKVADWIVDLGPEGGKFGGEIVAEGTPEELIKCNTPTGHAIKEILEGHFKKEIEKHLIREQSHKLKLNEEYPFVKNISVKDAEENNLKKVSVDIPREKITICTGPSGAGKSSFTNDTIYAEGQRRYIESLSSYAKQFVKQMPKPKIGHIEGLSPAIAIEQKAQSGNPRSTVGTMTEIYDYLRILYARLGTAHCPETGEVIRAVSKEYVTETILSYPLGEKIYILAPLYIHKEEHFQDLIKQLLRHGYLRIRLNGEFFELDPSSPIPFNRKRKNELFLVIDRLKVDPSLHTRLFEAVENASFKGGGKLVVMRENGDVFFNLSFSVPSTGQSYPEITPKTFGFNTAEGMCHECQGLGYQYGANFSENEKMLNQSTVNLMHYLWKDYYNEKAFSLLSDYLKKIKLDPFLTIDTHSSEQVEALLKGQREDEWIETNEGFRFRWLGINRALERAGKSALQKIKEPILPFLEERICSACEGERINALARHVTIDGISLPALCQQPLQKVLEFIKKQTEAAPQALLKEIYSQLVHRLSFLIEVGLNYISLERRAPTLSGGETQRIRLARQLGSGLTNVLYVLEGPTMGLHPHDNEKLNSVLKKLKEYNNTLLIVEHDPLTIALGDHIIDFGPGAGKDGGTITAQGTLEEIKVNENSLTGAYLSKRKKLPSESRLRPIDQKQILITHANTNNLKNITVSLPIAALTCITGVSGSGKSTLLSQILVPAAEKLKKRKKEAQGPIVINQTTIDGLEEFSTILSIDQNPTGHTSRADVGTFTDLMTLIREFFSNLPAAKTRGLQPKHFSYNHLRGMCSGCWGLGYRRIEMQFLPPVKVVCEDCKGMRLNPISLEVLYQDKNLGQYLDHTIFEIKEVFKNHPKIVRIADTLISVGIGYLKIGQEIVSLSTGEAQRLKLAKELSKRTRGKTLYLIDEPSTGLHFEDIGKLIVLFQEIVDQGHTIVMIEHQLDLIKSADYIIELGPEAGENGGYVICKGRPKDIIKNSKSKTGPYLKEERNSKTIKG